MYLVDANVLIEAKNRYYAFDIAPGFWTWLDQAHRQAVACSIEAVRDELVVGGDELAEWARSNAASSGPSTKGRRGTLARSPRGRTPETSPLPQLQSSLATTPTISWLPTLMSMSMLS